MADRTMFIHIGLHKCGSTTLQHTLTENRGKLLEQGYFYSVDHLPSITQHSHLALFLRGGERDQFNAAITSIRGDFERSAQNHIVLSGEEFSTLNPNLVTEFCQNMRSLDFPGEIRVMLYARNLYRFMASLIAQYSKAGDAIIYPQTALSRMKAFDPSDVIRRWEDAVGKSNVQMECLDSLPSGRDIVDSFANFIGADLVRVETEVRERNQSADAIASSILSHLAFQFGLPDTLFYRAYFAELNERFVFPKTEDHQYGLMDEWVAGVDLSHPKLLHYETALRKRPMARPVPPASGDDDTLLEDYLLFMSSVLKNTSVRARDRRLRLSRAAKVVSQA